MRKRTQLVGFEYGQFKHMQYLAEFVDNALDAIESFQWREEEKSEPQWAFSLDKDINLENMDFGMAGAKEMEGELSSDLAEAFEFTGGEGTPKPAANKGEVEESGTDEEEGEDAESEGNGEENGGEDNGAVVAAPEGAEATEGAAEGTGLGEALGGRLEEIADPRFAPLSLVLGAYRASVPVTVHVALGTDTPHMHSAADPAAIGRTTHQDFRLFCALVAELDCGGVYLNTGSAVVLPEVFLKAVSAVRNLGHRLEDFTTVNLDFLQHYRPRVNVVERPHARGGGRGLSLTGHHELLIPLIAAVLIEGES